MEEAYLKDVIKIFNYYRDLGDRAMDQLQERELFVSPDEQSNSIAVIVKHLSGNMLSRWTDFLNTDGEKPWRNREGEFVSDLETGKQVTGLWNKGWDCLFDALNSLGPEDMKRTIYIRNTGHAVSEAINRQLAHYAYHVGQIVFLAKQMKKGSWSSLSIPRGGSKEFNEHLFSKKKTNRHFTDDL